MTDADPVEVNHCVTCGSDNIHTTLSTLSSENGVTSSYLVRCDSCHSHFSCMVTASSDPATEVRKQNHE